ncbi:MAG: hypothetical protein AAF614_34065 [Chloroflexota bacterium]
MMIFTKRLTHLFLGVVATMLLLVSVASAATTLVVTPTGSANQEGQSANFGILAAASAFTIQQALVPAQLGGLQAGDVITGLTFRTDRSVTSHYPTSNVHFSDYEISLGSPASAVGTLSNRFADNRGNDMVLVRSGRFDMAKNSFRKSSSKPHPFGQMITFDTPYTYQGGDLLLEITHTGHSGNGSHFLDVAKNLGNTQAQLIIGLGFQATQTSAANNKTGRVFVVQFEVEEATGPVAEAGGPYEVDEGSSVQLDGSGTTDPDQDPATLTYEWDLDNDGSYDDATGITPAFDAANLDGPDSQTVGLQVTDADGNVSTDTATVDIKNKNPRLTSADIPGPIGVGGSATVTFFATDVPGDPLIWEFDCDADFTFEVGPQASNSVTCTFDTEGDHRVITRLEDGDGGRVVAYITVRVVGVCDPSRTDGNVIHGTDRRDRITGTEGNDIIYGYGDSDTIDGKGGNDCIIGGEGSDRLIGGEGNDEIWGGDYQNENVYDRRDRDRLYGNAGNDIMHGGGDHDHLEGDEGDDVMYGDDGNDGMHGDDGNDEMHGGNGKDRMEGRDGDDTMYGDAGDDTIVGRDGNDYLNGGDDKDRLEGGDGDDEMHGGEHNDRMNGDDGNDLMYGDGGEDSMQGRDGEDTMYGGFGDDDMNGGRDNDMMWGNEDNDRMDGDRGDDMMYGNEGNDIVDGRDGEDYLEGNAGDDELKGGKDDDTLDGGADNDRLDGHRGEDTCLNGESLKACEIVP